MPTIGQKLNALSPGSFIRVDKVSPAGTLEARKLASGAVVFYWRVTLAGKTTREPIGAYDSSAPPRSVSPTERGYSVEAARRAAQTLATAHYAHRENGGHTALKKAARETKAAASTAAQRAAQQTVKLLLYAYCDHLKARGRDSHRNARSLLRLHFVEAFADIAALPATACTTEHVVDAMRRLHELGHRRTANKLRAYVHAAYEVAKRAHSDATIPVAFRAFAVRTNPAAEAAQDLGANRPAKDPLSSSEMREYWNAIKGLPGLKGAVLRLHLLTGAQRMEQLTRAKTAEIQDGAMMLYDVKGKPGKSPRPHLVPLTSSAATALQECSPVGEFALSTTGGKKRLAATTLAGWAQTAVGDRIARFQAKRLRSGVETLLARAGVNKEDRGRLQSHGISGVQAAHYDGHDYLKEKRMALEVLERWLKNEPDTESSRSVTRQRTVSTRRSKPNGIKRLTRET